MEIRENSHDIEQEPATLQHVMNRILEYFEKQGVTNLSLIEKSYIRQMVENKGQNYFQKIMDTNLNVVNFFLDWSSQEYHFDFNYRVGELVSKGLSRKEAIEQGVLELNQLRSISRQG